jgi:hypothetical protein
MVRGSSISGRASLDDDSALTNVLIGSPALFSHLTASPLARTSWAVKLILALSDLFGRCPMKARLVMWSV